MEQNGGKWVALDQYATRRGVSKSTLYRRIRKRELTGRSAIAGTEILLRGGELEAYEQSPETMPNDMAATPLDMDLDAEDAYSIAEQTLRTLIDMHKEVLAEKSRMLKEWEEELRRREERLEELTAANSAKQAQLDERYAEVRDLKRTIRHRDELIKEHERALKEHRRLQEQREEMERFADSSREELNGALAGKDRLLEEKDRIINDMRQTLSNREDGHREDDSLVKDLQASIEKSRKLLLEKDSIIETLKTGETKVLEDGIRARDQEIAELLSLVQTLEKQLEMQAHAKELTGFSEEAAPETGMLIQEQLEYLMQSEDARSYLDEGIAPEEENKDESL